jgi:hypothetical protein
MEPLMQNSASRRIVGGLVVLAVLVGISIWWVSSRSAAPAQGGDARTPPAAEASEAPAASAQTETAEGAVTPATAAAAEHSSLARTSPSSPPATAPAVPLPPPETPLLQVIDELERRARAGDAAASCRLGFELLRCKRKDAMTLQRDLLSAGLARGATGATGSDAQRAASERAMIDMVARSDLMLEQANAVCDGLDPRAFETPLTWLYSAATAGDPTSRTALLRHVDSINQGDTLANLDVLASFRRQAPDWIAEDFQRATPVVDEIATQLGFVMQPGLLLEVIGSRPALAHALFQIHDRKPSTQSAPGADLRRAVILAQLPPADAATAAEAASIVARYDAARAAAGPSATVASSRPSFAGLFMAFDPARSAAACGHEPSTRTAQAGG